MANCPRKTTLVNKIAAVKKYPRLNAILNKIENVSHALELTDGRYGYIKYLRPIYDYYTKSKERRTRRRDRRRICQLRGIGYWKRAHLLGVLIQATSSISKSTRGKYVAKLRMAAKQGVASEDLPAFIKRAKKKRAVRAVQRSLPPHPSLLVRQGIH